MRRTITAELLPGLLLPLVLGMQNPPATKGGGATTPAAADAGGGGGGYKLRYQVGGPTVPVWSDIARALITMFAGDASNAQDFAEIAGASPGLGGITGALSSSQGLIGIFILLGYALLLGVTFGGAGIIAARFQKKCGGQRIQVISPDYMDIYGYYRLSVGLTGVCLMITAICLFLNKGDVGTGLSDGMTVYADGVSDLKQWAGAAGGGAADKGKAEGKPGDKPDAKPKSLISPGNSTEDMNSTTSRDVEENTGISHELPKLADNLNANFRDDFGNFAKRRVAAELGFPSFSVLEDCRQDSRNLSRTLGKEGKKGLGALFAAVSARCHRAGKAQEKTYSEVARTVEDATVVSRKQMLRRVQAVLARQRARYFEIGAQAGAGVDGLISKVAKYEADGGTVSSMSFWSGLPMLLIVALTLITPCVAIGGMIFADPEHDNRPTIRSAKSNTGGLVIVYSTIGIYICLIVSVYVSITTYGVSAAGEIYVCGPYNSKNFKPLDEIFYTAWRVSERGPGFAGLCPSEVLTKCARGATLTELAVPSYIKGGGGGGDTAAANTTGGEKKGSDKKEGDKPAPPSLAVQQVHVQGLVPKEWASGNRTGEDEDAVESLVATLSSIASGKHAESVQSSLDSYSEKWLPLMNPSRERRWTLGAIRAALVRSIDRYYAEYMKDIDGRLRWIQAETAKQGGGESCQPVFNALNIGLQLFCGVFLTGVEGFWLAQTMDFVLLLVFAPLCLGLANHYLLMDSYTYGDYDARKVRRREERERLGLVKKKKKKKKKKKEEEAAAEDDDSSSAGGGEDDTTEDSSG